MIPPIRLCPSFLGHNVYTATVDGGCCARQPRSRQHRPHSHSFGQTANHCMWVLNRQRRRRLMIMMMITGMWPNHLRWWDRAKLFSFPFFSQCTVYSIDWLRPTMSLCVCLFVPVYMGTGDVMSQNIFHIWLFSLLFRMQSKAHFYIMHFLNAASPSEAAASRDTSQSLHIIEVNLLILWPRLSTWQHWDSCLLKWVCSLFWVCLDI